MKKQIIVSAVLCVFVLAACGSTGGTAGGGSANGLSLAEAIEHAAEKTAEELPKGSRVAVLAFDSANDTLSGYIIEELNGALFDRGIEVADRSSLELVYQELNFQMSGDVSDESALSIGKFLGADIVITGQLTAFGDLYRFRVTALSVETSTRVGNTRLDVRSDANLQRMAGGAQ